MKKLFVIILTVALVSVMAFACASCGSKADYTVGILQYVNHVALDAATKGFQDALQEEMDKAGKTVKFDYQNASGETANCNTIANKFVSKKYDLIMANATPALQAAAARTDSIPILGTSITEYGIALGLTDFNGTVGGNISGTSDLADLQEQANMFSDFLPDVKKVGLLYCSAEANSKYQIDKMVEYLTAKGITTVVKSFSETNDLTAVATALVDEVEALYIPTDNTVASNTEKISAICLPKKLPVITGEEGICAGCGVATLSISYYKIGYQTGVMAAEILLRGADISKMPIQADSAQTYKYNEEICNELGLTVPTNHDYKKI